MFLNNEIQKIDELKNKIKILEDELSKKNIEIQNFISQNNNKKINIQSNQHHQEKKSRPSIS